MTDFEDFAVGDRVQCQRSAPAKGTWRRYAGEVGTVTVVDRNAGELGVDLGPTVVDRPHKTTWFLPHELVTISRTALHARQGPPEAR